MNPDRRLGWREWWGRVVALGLVRVSERLAGDEAVVKLVAMGWVEDDARRAVKQARIDGVSMERLLQAAAAGEHITHRVTRVGGDDG